MTRVLILSTTTGYQLRSFGDAATKLGVELTFATDRCHALDDPWQDSAVPVRFFDEDGSLEAVLEADEARPIDGVIAVGDRPVVLAARITEALRLKGNSPIAARASANKRLAREAFERSGLPVPWHFSVRTTTDPQQVAFRARYPCVIKPLGLSGSRGVIRANDPHEMICALQRVYALLARPEIKVLRTGLEGEVMIDGYVEGREYAIEGVLTDGEFHPFALFDKPDPLDGPFFEETIYVTPSRLSDVEQSQVFASIARACSALGLTHGPVHAECRVGPEGIFVLEVAARPIGGLCSRVLRFGERGQISLEEVLLCHALGQDITAMTRDPRASAVMMIPIPAKGHYKGVQGQQAARRVDGVEDVTITAKIDQLLEPLPEAGSYLGFIFARADTPERAEAAVREAHRRLQFEIDPVIPVVQA